MLDGEICSKNSALHSTANVEALSAMLEVGTYLTLPHEVP